jgi:hypothetical protein
MGAEKWFLEKLNPPNINSSISLLKLRYYLLSLFMAKKISIIVTEELDYLDLIPKIFHWLLFFKTKALINYTVEQITASQ